MRKFVFWIMIIVFIPISSSGTQATTVMIDPATQDSPQIGEAIIVNVKALDVTDLFAYQFDLVFDNAALKLADISAGEFLGSDGTDTLAFLKVGDQQIYFDIPPDMLESIASSGQTVESDVTEGIAEEVNSTGILTVVGVRIGSTVSVDGTGALASITFEVLEAKDSTLQLQNVDLGTSVSDSEARFIFDESTDTVENGTLVTPGTKGDVNEDGGIGSDDAILALRISAHLVTPSDYQRWAADMDNDGEVRANDAMLILRAAAGLVAPSVYAIAAGNRHTTVTLAEAYGVAGENITVPIKVDSINRLGGGDISISYDPEVLRAARVSSGNDLLMASNLKEPGTLHIAFANSDRLNSRTLATIEFSILADSTSPLAFRIVELYTPDAISLVSRGVNQEFISWAIPPDHSELLQNFPNPFNPETWIPYQLRETSDVTIRIYDTVGGLVRELDLGHKSAGLYVSQDRAAHWDGRSKLGSSVASGVYFYSIQAGDFAAVRKLIVLR